MFLYDAALAATPMNGCMPLILCYILKNKQINTVGEACVVMRSVAFATMFFAVLLPSPAHANDFPTQARVEYVLQCMDSRGGQKFENLYSCICVIDKIAETISYDEYAEAEVFAQLRSTPGERGGVFRDPERASLLVEKIKDVTGVAEKSCFVTSKARSAE